MTKQRVPNELLTSDLEMKRWDQSFPEENVCLDPLRCGFCFLRLIESKLKMKLMMELKDKRSCRFLQDSRVCVSGIVRLGVFEIVAFFWLKWDPAFRNFWKRSQSRSGTKQEQQKGVGKSCWSFHLSIVSSASRPRSHSSRACSTIQRGAWWSLFIK